MNTQLRKRLNQLKSVAKEELREEITTTVNRKIDQLFESIFLEVDPLHAHLKRLLRVGGVEDQEHNDQPINLTVQASSAFTAYSRVPGTSSAFTPASNGIILDYSQTNGHSADRNQNATPPKLPQVISTIKRFAEESKQSDVLAATTSSSSSSVLRIKEEPVDEKTSISTTRSTLAKIKVKVEVKSEAIKAEDGTLYVRPPLPVAKSESEVAKQSQNVDAQMSEAQQPESTSQQQPNTPPTPQEESNLVIASNNSSPQTPEKSESEPMPSTSTSAVDASKSSSKKSTGSSTKKRPPSTSGSTRTRSSSKSSHSPIRTSKRSHSPSHSDSASDSDYSGHGRWLSSSSSRNSRFRVDYINCTADGCTIRLASRQALDHHLLADHDIEPFRCPLVSCRVHYGSKTELLTHFTRDHHSQSTWRCHQCTEHFPHPRLLGQHIFFEHEIGHFTCTYEGCSYSASRRTTVYDHYGRMHGGAYERAEAKRRAKRQAKVRKEKVARAVTSTSTSTMPKKPKAKFEILTLKCLLDHCHEFVMNQEGLVDHLNDVHNMGVYFCPAVGCDKTYDARSQVEQHVTEKHASVSTWHCPKCSTFIVDNYEALDSHLFRAHHEGQFRCTRCPKLGLTRLNIIEHYDAIH